MSPVLKMTLEEIEKATGGKTLSRMKTEFSGVGTDTRTDLAGKVFVALKGENFDAHDFLGKAVEAGADALIVHRLPHDARMVLDKVTVVEVPDTLKAFQDLGHYWRRKMRAIVLALTGSNGKTTTKEFAAQIIGSRRKVHNSKGSFNNHWGVPMTLLALDSSHEVALVEMGMNHPGELTRLCEIADPDVVAVTMVGRGHLEGLGSLEGVARAKAEIYEASRDDATLIFNLENEHTRRMYERFQPQARGEVITFAGTGKQPFGIEPDISLEVVAMELESMTIRGRIRGVSGEVSVPVFGAQNITNLMAAAALALGAGLTPDDIWTAFPQCRTVWGRNQWVRLASGARALFDGYNANPESMQAAIENFSLLKVPGRKFAILGEMREMGSHTAQVHQEIGELAARAGFDGICFFGPSGSQFAAGLKSGGFSKSQFISDSYEQGLAPRMLPVLDGNDIVLIKGSRGMRLERALMDLDPLDFQEKK